jgi:hypothetical protein
LVSTHCQLIAPYIMQMLDVSENVFQGQTL